jgi:hypothetical protein
MPDAFQNTDQIVWTRPVLDGQIKRIARISITKEGNVDIRLGSSNIVKPIEEWFKMAQIMDRCIVNIEEPIQGSFGRYTPPGVYERFELPRDEESVRIPPLPISRQLEDLRNQLIQSVQQNLNAQEIFTDSQTFDEESDDS